MNPLRVVISTFVFLAAFAGVARADALPRLRCSREEGEARVVIFSPDGRCLVSSGADGHQLRDAATGAVRSILAGPRVGFYGPELSPDGRTLYAEIRSDDLNPVVTKDLRAWDVATGRAKATFSHVHEGMGDGHFVLSKGGNRLAFLDNSDRLPMQIKWSKMSIDSRTFDYAYNANPALPRVMLWDLERWEPEGRVDGGLPMVLSRDGKTLVTGDRDWNTPVAKVWDAETRRLRRTLQGRDPGIEAIAISPEGRFLASGNRGMTSLWNLSTGRHWEVGARGTRVSLAGPAFSPDGRFLFPDGTIQVAQLMGQGKEHPVYDLAEMPPERLGLGPAELAFAPDGRRYAAVIGDRFLGGPFALAFRGLPSMDEIGRVGADGLLRAGFSPDGHWLALLIGRYEGPEKQFVVEIKLVDPMTATVRFTIPSPGKTWGNYGWKFSPDGNTLAIHYRAGSQTFTAGEPSPCDRPMSLDLWEPPPR